MKKTTKLNNKSLYMKLKEKYLIKNLVGLRKLAKELAFYLKPNTFLLLQGNLGSGKTTLVQMIAKQLGIEQVVNSPTFTICQQYEIDPDYQLNHFDFFRLSSGDDLDIFQEIAQNNLNIIEWPEKSPQFWQGKDCIKVEMIEKEKNTRLVIIKML